MGPDILVPIPSLGSTYFFWPEGLQNGEYVLGSDRLLYLQFDKTDGYTPSLDLCKKIQATALPQHTNTSNIMPWLGLTMDEQRSIMMWENAGPYNSTEVAATTPVKYLAAETTSTTAFIFNNGTLEELPKTQGASTLCQANPLGIDW
ncbi:hypothetical protein Pcinc_038319 [Petrolisthes cinctipes]|uniref:Uncharacterized protein n=1 Tax=Petrolisthes cinctipes TaxID=88211 RepID=A0AAE1EKI1_PETCI|nr:hypothetical protein Pcinc_038319 [Petrolisthes cinctipes]